MTDDGLLSQDEIDALLSTMGGEEGSNEIPVSTTANENLLAQEPTELLEPLIKKILAQAASVIGTAANRSIDLSVNKISQADISDLSAFQAGDYLCLASAFEAGLAGKLDFVISKKVTATLADLMMMGDGSAEYEDDHKDALTELGNQVLGGISTALGSEFQLTVTAGQAATTEFDGSSINMELTDSIIVDIDVNMDGQNISKMALLLEETLVKTLLKHTDTSVLNRPKEQLSDENDEYGEKENSDFDPGLLGAPTEHSRSRLSTNVSNEKIQMLLDIPLTVTIELGRTQMSIRKILELGPGSIIELDRLAGEPVDLMVNNKVVAKGEVVVIDEYFGIRILSLVSPEERLKQIR